jgi:hypothetical protein
MTAQTTGFRRLACCVISTALLAACAGCNGSSEPALANAQPSPSALAHLVLDAFARGDRATLQALALDESEFRVHVWPSLPAARPERNLPFSYVWGELKQKSEASLASTLARSGGHRYALVDVQFADAPTDYAGFVVHGGTTLVVRNESGTQETVRVCGSLLEKDGVWKVFSYVVDD